MTPAIDDGQSDRSARPCAAADQIWSKADFLHRIQTLARRLANWHVDDDGPVWTPTGVDFLREVERSFRYRVLHGKHDPKENSSASIQLIPSLPPDRPDGTVVGQALTLHPDEHRKDVTIWLFRDIYEHLGQLGDSEFAKLLRLKLEQLLNSRMYRRASSDVFGDYIAGHPVPQPLLDELVEAAKLCFGKDELPPLGNSRGEPLKARNRQPSQLATLKSLMAITPKLDTKSMEWIAARKENEKKLGYPTATLAKYRLESEGGRQLSPYFGVDRDGRRWRRDESKTPKSAVFYYAEDLKRYGKKA